MIRTRHLFVAYGLILIVIFPLYSSAMYCPVAPPDTSARASNPRTALLLGIIPGGGQIYNRKWAKAALVIAMDTYAITQFQASREQFNDFEPTAEEPDNPYLSRRNRHAWRVLLFYLLGVLDGYVDSHLSTFPADTTYEVLPQVNIMDEEQR